MNRVIVHFDKSGLFDIHADDDTTVIICDDRTPNDWAFKMSDVSVGTVDQVLGDATIGSCEDDKHEKAEFRILYGKPKEVN